MMLLLILVICAGLQVNATPKPRNFMLVFEMTSYTPQVKEALDFFFKEIFKKGDMLIVNTPAKFYSFSKQKLNNPKKLAVMLHKTIKSDISGTGSKYRSTLKEMERLVRSLHESGVNIDSVLQAYRENRQYLRQVTEGQEQKLLKYANIFRSVKHGDNHIIMFFQKQYRPIPDRIKLDQLRGSVQYGFKAMEVFTQEKFKDAPDFKKISAALKYAGVKFHFLYMEGKIIRSRREVEYVENMVEFYSTYSDVAKATNGLNLTTAKPSNFLNKVEKLVEGTVSVEVLNEEQEKEKKN